MAVFLSCSDTDIRSSADRT